MLNSIISTFKNCWKIPELKSRILFTLGVLAICRLMAWIRIPGLDAAALTHYLDSQPAAANSLVGMYSMMTGGAMEHCAIGSLGIMPYISATIVIQLLTGFVGSMSKMAREEGGRTKLIKWGRYLTVALCIGQGAAMAIGWEHPATIFNGFTGQLVLTQNLWWYRFETVLLLTTGTLVLMWLGEQITDRGIGNGVSLVITIGILARLPSGLIGMVDMFRSSNGGAAGNLGTAIVLVALLVGVVAGVVAVTQAQRKIPVQYAQRAVGRKIYSGSASFLPLRLNFSGVMPIIFASAILMFPQQICSRLGVAWNISWLARLGAELQDRSPVYLTIYGLMILFFSFFWTASQFNEIQIADDLKKNGGYIPGVRPGLATSTYLHNAMTRITLAGAVFLVVIAVIPIILTNKMNVPPLVAQFFGGTSMLINVGVLLDTLRQMESHLLMRHYDGFLKGGRGGHGPRLRGRF